MKCPVNGAPMIVVERHGIELDYCPICKGIWFDAGEPGAKARSMWSTRV